MRDFSRCPRCQAPTQPCRSFAGTTSEYWLECTRCNTYINTYIPQAHQEAVHRDTHRYIGNFGGYGTGKTTTSREEVLKHALITPKGNTLIGANVTSQYEQTIKRDLEADIPSDFVKDYSAQKSYMDLLNGHRIMFRPFDDPDKLRSYNLSMFVIVEASETKREALTQLKTRLRNLAATTPKRDKDGNIIYKLTKNKVPIPEIDHDWRKGIIESNPDAGWVRSDILMNSHQITKHGRILDNYVQVEAEIDKNISSHVASTDVNAFLPDGFIDELIKNKPAWWVNRFILSSFSYAEGLIYPSAMASVIPDIKINPGWRRIVAHDYGLSDIATFVFGAVDEHNGILYIYKDVRTNNRNVEELAQLFHTNCEDIPLGGWICPPIIDPRSEAKRDYDKKTLGDHYAEYGIYFKPGFINLDARIFRLNTYFETKRIKIFESCTGLIKELKDYKWKPRTMDDTGWGNKPEDKNNHSINALEWITMELPADPRKMSYGILNKYGRDVTKPQEPTDDWLPNALREDPLERYDTPFGMVDYTFGG